MPYSNDPSSSPLDAVRFWLGDTGDTQLLDDEELRYLIDLDSGYTGGDARLIAAAAAEQIISKYAGRTTIVADGVTYSPGELTDKYAALAKTLREGYARSTGNGALPIFGTPDRAHADEPVFSLGMYDNPEGLSQFGDAREDRWDPSNYQVG